MSTYKIAVCDDEESALELISSLVKKEFAKIDENVQINKFTNPELLLESSRECGFDMVFLDIDMPSIGGIQAAKKIKIFNPKTLIVFVTGKDELVFKSFQVHPFSFIRKSRLIEEIPEVVADIKSHFSYNDYAICFKIQGIDYILLTDEIVCIKSSGNYITIKTTDMAEYRYKDSINKKDTELTGHGFVRTHERYLVNLKYITRINKKSVTMTQKYEVPMSRHRMAAVAKSYADYYSRD